MAEKLLLGIRSIWHFNHFRGIGFHVDPKRTAFHIGLVPHMGNDRTVLIGNKKYDLQGKHVLTVTLTATPSNP